MEVSVLDAEEVAGGQLVPEAPMFQKLRTTVVPKQKEILCALLFWWETEPTSLLMFTFCLRGKIREAKLIL